jgi:hypothetical protein
MTTNLLLLLAEVPAAKSAAICDFAAGDFAQSRTPAHMRITQKLSTCSKVQNVYNDNVQD